MEMKMAEYIDRQATIDIVAFECGKWTGLAKEISKQLKQLPAADVAPVVHGKWKAYSPITIRCSICGHVIHDWRYSECKFCPNCGAKMDAQGEE